MIIKCFKYGVKSIILYFTLLIFVIINLVELVESKCEGMVRYQSLEGKWSADTTSYTITSEHGDKIRLGDPLKVVVKSVDLERKQIDFTIL